MFYTEEDAAAYEDELYREASSSDESVDSEIECYLYRQVHYCSNLKESDTVHFLESASTSDKTQNVKVETQNLKAGSTSEKISVITISDSDDISASDSSAVILLDSLDEDSVNFSKTKGKRFKTIHLPATPSTSKFITTGAKKSKVQRSETVGSSKIHPPATPSTSKLYPRATPSTSKFIKTGKNVSKDQRSESVGSSKTCEGGLLQKVLVIGESSDEEEKDEDTLMSDSEQSSVENWMLLGRANEDGDTSIQLNTEGCSQQSEGENTMEWTINKKDMEAQVKNFPRRSTRRYFTDDKNIMCRNCNIRGHLSKNCPEPKKLPACILCGQRGHIQHSCPTPYCANCFLPGHFYQDCRDKFSWQKKCKRCEMIGHYTDACPEIWRQYHLTVKPGPPKTSESASICKAVVYCYNCGRKGHCGYECREWRMHRSVHPSCELVFSYDSENDIKKRNQRAKNKYKELQESGMLPYQIIKPLKDERERAWLMKKERKKRRRESKREKDKVNWDLNKSRKEKAKRIKQEAEDFPRGKPEEKPRKAAKKHKNKFEHLLFKNWVDKKDYDGQQMKHKKRCRVKKGKDSNDDLLTIKQRKKKSQKR